MDSARASRNAVASTVQTVASAALMFVFYRQLLTEVGADGLGVWSVILASTGAVRIGELGLVGGAVKFVAERRARDDTDGASRVVETTALTVAVAVGVFAVGAYLVLRELLPAFVPPRGIEAAQELLPYAAASLWLTAVAGAFQSGLDGCGRIDLRNAVAFGAQVLYVVLGLVWVSGMGLIGLAYAQIVQGVFLGVVCWGLVRRELGRAPLVPWRWDRLLFREMLSYGLQFQLLSVLRMLYEPITKALMSRFGGLDAAGYYEMATLAVTKLRALIVSAQQVLTPEVAELGERDPGRVNAVLADADRLNWYLCIPLFVAAIAGGPLLSHLWIGHVETVFVVFVALLSLGWLANALSGPAYFVLLGTGELRGVVASHATIAVVNAAGGALLGAMAGASGVAGAWALALMAGAVHLGAWVRRDRGVAVVPPQAGALIGASVVALAVGISLLAISPTALWASASAAGAALAILAVPIWTLPDRHRIEGLLRRIRAGATSGP